MAGKKVEAKQEAKAPEVKIEPIEAKPVREMVFIVDMATKKKDYRRGDKALLTEDEIVKFEKFNAILSLTKWNALVKQVKELNGVQG